MEPAHWGAHVRGHWLPEDLDARPWIERCGYEPTGIRRPRLTGAATDADRRRELNEARDIIRTLALEHLDHAGRQPFDALCAQEPAAAAARGVLRRVDDRIRETSTPPGEWTEEDELELREVGPRLGLELAAAALHRTPAEITARSRASGVDLHGSVEVWCEGALWLTQLDRDVFERLGWDVASLSVRAAAHAMGVSHEGARAILDLDRKSVQLSRIQAAVDGIPRPPRLAAKVPLRAVYEGIIEAERRRRRVARCAVCAVCGDEATRGKRGPRPLCDTHRKAEQRARLSPLR